MCQLCRKRHWLSLLGDGQRGWEAEDCQAGLGRQACQAALRDSPLRQQCFLSGWSCSRCSPVAPWCLAAITRWSHSCRPNRGKHLGAWLLAFERTWKSLVASRNNLILSPRGMVLSSSFGEHMRIIHLRVGMQCGVLYSTHRWCLCRGSGNTKMSAWLVKTYSLGKKKNHKRLFSFMRKSVHGCQKSRQFDSPQILSVSQGWVLASRTVVFLDSSLCITKWSDGGNIFYLLFLLPMKNQTSICMVLPKSDFLPANQEYNIFCCWNWPFNSINASVLCLEISLAIQNLLWSKHS